MNYKEFIEKVCVDIKVYLEEEFRDAEVKFNSVKKLQNSSYEGILITPKDSCISLSLDLREYYVQLVFGRNWDGIIKEIAKNASEELKVKFSMNDFTENYSALKHRLFPQLISYNDNKDVLKNYPHKRMEDFAIVYRVLIDYCENTGEEASFIIGNSLFERFGISVDELHKDVISTASEKRPAFLKNIVDILNEKMGVDKFENENENPTYVAGIDKKSYGAAVILYKDFLKDAAFKLGGSFYILPSSIHDCIFIPDDGDFQKENLLEMVKDVNSNEISPKDKLTDSVYYYDAETDKFSQIAGDSMVEKIEIEECEMIG